MLASRIILEAKRIEECELTRLKESAILEQRHLVPAGIFEQEAGPVRNLELFTVKLPATTLEVLDCGLQVPNLKHRQNRGCGTMAREEKQRSTADLDRNHPSAHAGEIPDLLGFENGRVIFEILANVRTSHVKKA